MNSPSLSAPTALFAAMLWSATAVAGPGNTTADVNMRTGPGVRYAVITTIPAGAPVQVFECSSWCQVGFAGTHGFVSANYIAGGFTEPAPRPYYQSPVFYQPEPTVIIEPEIVEPEGYYEAESAEIIYYPWIVAPRHRWHYRRGDGAYFEFGP